MSKPRWRKLAVGGFGHYKVERRIVVWQLGKYVIVCVLLLCDAVANLTERA